MAARQSLSNNNASSSDEGILVAVSPAQSAYFAGEPFVVTVSFTNTRSPDSVPAISSTHYRSHKRGAHSISSAPMAKPPTSPGPKSAQMSFSQSSSGSGGTTEEHIRRRGLIGASVGALGGVNGNGKRRPSPLTSEIGGSGSSKTGGIKRTGRSQSVQITPQDLISQLTDEPPHSPIPRRAVPEKALPGTVDSRIVPVALPPSHPHARKTSLPENSPSPQSSQDLSSALSLDPIRESSSPQPPPTPSIPSPIPDATTPFFDIHLGRSRPSHSSIHPPRPASAQLPPPSSFPLPPRTRAVSAQGFSPPGAELILWAYAQLSGALELDDMIVRPGAVDELRSKLSKGRVVGGGSMDMSAMNSSRSRGGFLSALLSPPIPSSPTPQTKGSPSLLAGVSSLFGSPSAAGQANPEEQNQLPTFQAQQSMLVVDLSLAPGETRSYTYKIPLPHILPPTFRGRAQRFSYQLTIGTCRCPPGGGPDKQQSRVMKIPIRIYNHVAVGRVQRPYDLLWPVARRRDGQGAGNKVTIEEVAPSQVAKEREGRQTASNATENLSTVESYARRLLSLQRSVSEQELLASPGERRHPSSTGPMRPSSPGFMDHTPLGSEDVLGDGPSSCRESVEILTRNPKRVSYDVNKNGEKVAVLTFVKSAYRLGETVLGVVEFNDHGGRMRVLQFSATLEAHESLPSSLQAAPLNARATAAPTPSVLKRIHAEHHSSLIPGISRTTFALDIPSDAAPGFQILGEPLHGGLAWKVRICFSVSVLGSGKAADVRHLARDGANGDWGTAWRATGSIAPEERQHPNSSHGKGGWTSLFSSPFLGGDGSDDEDESEEGAWKEAGVETVECEVPIQVWPGNTAFRSLDILYSV